MLRSSPLPEAWIVSERSARTLPGDAPRWYLEEEAPDEVVPLAQGLDESPLDQFLAHQASVEASAAIEADAAPAEPRVKLSAAWLIEHAGFPKGTRRGCVGVSSRQAQAILNLGGATATDVVRLAAEIKRAVRNAFGISIVPEPVFVGFGESMAIEELFETGSSGE